MLTCSTSHIFQHLERKLTVAPQLQIRSILERAAVGLPTFTEALEARERALGVTTLASQTLLHLFSLYQQHVSPDLASSVIWHEPSLLASEKAAILPGHLVQKSITLRFAERLVLCSGVGDFRMSRPLLRQIARSLELEQSRYQRVRINPWEYPPEYLYGILEGMVSPFLRAGHVTHLEAVVFLAFSDAQALPHTQVAISLSPFESLLVPLASFQQVLNAYADATYPGRWIELPVEEAVSTRIAWEAVRV